MLAEVQSWRSAPHVDRMPPATLRWVGGGAESSLAAVVVVGGDATASRFRLFLRTSFTIHSSGDVTSLFGDRGPRFGVMPRRRLGFPGLALQRGALVRRRGAALGFLRAAAQVAREPFEGREYSINRRRARARVNHACVQYEFRGSGPGLFRPQLPRPVTDLMPEIAQHHLPIFGFGAPLRKQDSSYRFYSGGRVQRFAAAFRAISARCSGVSALGCWDCRKIGGASPRGYLQARFLGEAETAWPGS